MPESNRFPIGTIVRVARTKWRDVAHYAVDGEYLGADEHGDWVGVAEGLPVYRGNELAFTTTAQSVLCIPVDEWFMVHLLRGHRLSVYIDICTPPIWSDETVTMVDLDLDVIVSLDETTIVDQDEFAEHQVTYNYPAKLIESAQLAAEDVLERTLAGDAPFNPNAGARWHQRLNALRSGRSGPAAP